MWSNFHTLNNNPVGISSFYAYCINLKILFKKTHCYTGMSSSDTYVFSWLHSESFSGWQSELIIEVKKKERNLNITKISKQISTAMKLEVASKSFLWLSQFACPRLRTVFKHIQQFYTTEWWLLLIAFITRILVHCHRLRQNDDIIGNDTCAKPLDPFLVNIVVVVYMSFNKQTCSLSHIAVNCIL